MTHITPERMREFSTKAETPDEIAHTNQCDYCLEGLLMGDDPDQSDLKRWERNQNDPNFLTKKPKPQLRRPKDD
jgi:hypothetical protein